MQEKNYAKALRTKMEERSESKRVQKESAHQMSGSSQDNWFETVHEYRNVPCFCDLMKQLIPYVDNSELEAIKDAVRKAGFEP